MVGLAVLRGSEGPDSGRDAQPCMSRPRGVIPERSGVSPIAGCPERQVWVQAGPPPRPPACEPLCSCPAAVGGSRGAVCFWTLGAAATRGPPLGSRDP